MKERSLMFPLFKRAKVDLVSKNWADRKQGTYQNQELPENMFCMHAVHENESMNERTAAINPALVSRPTGIKSEADAGLDTVADAQKSLEGKSSEREQDQFVLRLECDRSCLTDSDGNLPDQEDAGSSSDMGTCPYCFDHQHVSALECPLQGISEAMAD
jgi:hypothetical protein